MDIFLILGNAQIVGGIVPNFVAFGLFVVLIISFACTGKMGEMVGLREKSK